MTSVEEAKAVGADCVPVVQEFDDVFRLFDSFKVLYMEAFF